MGERHAEKAAGARVHGGTERGSAPGAGRRGRGRSPGRAGRPPAGQAQDLPAIRWSGLGRRLIDHDGRPIPRPFALGQLPPSLEAMLGLDAGRALLEGLAGAGGLAGPREITAIGLELFQEGRLQLVFRVELRGRRGERRQCGLVLAKEGGGVGEQARREADLLRRLGQAAPGCCVEVLGDGEFLRRTESGRVVPLYYYLSRWLPAHRELAADRSHHFFVNDITLEYHRTRLDGEALRAEAIRILAALYDPQRRQGLVTPEVNSGDFVIRVPPRAPYELLLIAARGLTREEEPGMLVARLAGPAGRYADRPFRLCPAEPRRFFRSLRSGFAARLGREGGELLLREAVGSWLAGLSTGRFQLPPWFKRHELQAAYEELGDRG